MLFYDAQYLVAQPYEKVLGFEVEEENGNKASVFFNLDGKMASSLKFSLFGSVLGNASINSKRELLKYTHQQLLKNGIEEIVITHPIALYGFENPTSFFHSLGYKTDFADINQHIDLTSYRTSILHSMEKRKLEKGLQEGIECSLAPSSQVAVIHSFLSNCRAQKGLDINISAEKLSLLFRQFPDRYKCFTADLSGEMIAACVTVEVSGNVAYYYLPGTDEKYQKLSPMVILLDFICKYYQARDMDFLDLGISSVEGVKQEGLFLFKERMGAETLKKYQFSRVLE